MTMDEVAKLVAENPDQYEVRISWTGNMLVTSQQIEMMRFDMEMKQHYREEQEKHDLLMYAMKLRAQSFRSPNPFTWFWQS